LAILALPATLISSVLSGLLRLLVDFALLSRRFDTDLRAEGVGSLPPAAACGAPCRKPALASERPAGPLRMQQLAGPAVATLTRSIWQRWNS